ncbi:uncharacterized protein LOC132201393 [Neocloeon triangulifer]|uniref:uncharacterized protein LOC132201393 n=1 Tax=Neocloeon triangulifer TaxID=2078957 RepID=UPI00286F2C81|nr:uncharacterized protein LOC132201393 [Neocloeon triangulifer]
MILLVVACCLLCVLGFDEHQLDFDKIYKDDADLLTERKNDILILAGGTAIEKSILSKFLRRDPSLVIAKNAEQNFIFTYNNTKNIGSGNNLSTEVFPLNIEQDNDSEMSFISFLDYQDTPGPSLDLVTGYLNLKILNSGKRSKILIVQSYESMLGNKSGTTTFTTVVKNLVRHLKGSVDLYVDSIGLAAIGINDSAKTNTELKQSLRNFLKKIIEDLTNLKRNFKDGDDDQSQSRSDINDQIRLIKFILDGEKFELLHQPDTLGNPWELDALKKDYEDLRQLIITKLDFSTPAGANKYQVAMAPSTIRYIKNFLIPSDIEKIKNSFKVLYDNMLEGYNKKLTTKIVPLVKKIASALKYSKKISKLVEDTQRFDQLEYLHRTLVGPDLHGNKFPKGLILKLKKIQYLYGVTGDNVEVIKIRSKADSMFGLKGQLLSEVISTRRFQMFMTSIISDFDTYKIQTSNITSDLNSKVTFQILKTLLTKHGFTLETISHASGLSAELSQKEDLEKLLQSYKPVKESFHRDDAKKIEGTFSGKYVVLSRLANEIVKYNDLQSIIIIASRKIFIDTDLHLQDTHLALVSPIIEVVGGKRTIVLTGSDGTSHIESAEMSSTPGDDGDAGKQGGNGRSPGQIQILALKILNGPFLNIRSIGGNGGKGQNGGRGWNASPVNYPLCFDQYTGNKEGLKNRSVTEGYTYEDEEQEVRKVEVSTVLYNLLVTVTDRANASAGNGGPGGNAGFGGKSRKPEVHLKILEPSLPKNIVLEDGKPGTPGNGGEAGSRNNTCSYRKYLCTARTGSKLVLLIQFFIKSDVKYMCTNDITGFCESQLREANAGNDGLEGSVSTEYLNEVPAPKLHHLSLKFIQNSLNMSTDSLHQSTRELIEMVLTSNAQFSEMEENDFLNFLNTMDNLLEMTSQNSDDLDFIFNRMFESFKMFTQHCNKCSTTYLQLINLGFANQIENLRMFSSSKQIIRLPLAIANLMKYFDEISSDNKVLQAIQITDNAKQSALKEIADATKLVRDTIEKNIEEVRKNADAKIGDLFRVSDEARQKYTFNGINLEKQRRELGAAMQVKAILRVFKLSAKIGAAIMNPAAEIGPLIFGNNESLFGIATDLAKKVAGNFIESGYGTALKKIGDLRDRKHRATERCFGAIRNIIDADSKLGGVITVPELRTQLLQMLEIQKESDNINPETQAVLLERANDLLQAVQVDLEAKIEMFDTLSDDKRQMKKEELQKLSNGVKEIIESEIIGETAEQMREQAKDDFAIQEVNKAIEENSLALKKIDQYEKQIDDEIQPLLNGMFVILENIKVTGIKNDTSKYILQFQNLDIRKYSRSLISIFNKFLEDFDEVKGDLRNILVDLEDLMGILTRSYDKISEVNHQIELKDFLGKLHNGNCDNVCQVHKNITNSIETNELVRRFVHIFIAYQQCLFPYGGETMSVLRSTLSELRQGKYKLSRDDKIKILKNSLQTMSKNLAETNTAIINDVDIGISFSSFNSKYLTSKPFYTWPGSKFGSEIKKLLMGEKVTLVASVTAPSVKNAVKFNTVMINFTSSDQEVSKQVQEMLMHYWVEMTYGGESYYRCGSNYYAISGDPLDFKFSYERDDKGQLISRNSVFEKLQYSDVPLSPYTVWKFKLVHSSGKDQEYLSEKLSQYAEKLDLELIGDGYFVEEGARICSQDLGQFYNYYGNTL